MAMRFPAHLNGLLLPLLSLGLLSACSSKDDSRDEVPPVDRVFLISCDTLRADRLGFYGYEPNVSPNLDALAAQAVVFDEAYACAPMTRPAVSSLLSGRFPTEIGVTPGNRKMMPAQVETVAETVQRNGIETAAVVSNFLLRKDPKLKGFGVSQGFDHFDDRMPDKETNRALRERRAGNTTDAALEWLEGHVERKAPRCFFWVHYQDPHGPYTPPPASQQLFERELGSEHVPLGKGKLGRHQIPHYQELENSTNPDLYRGRYDAEIHYFDEEVGRLLDWLKANDLLENALVLFTADHGEALGEHDYWFCHGESLHREIVRIPFFVKAPAGFPLPGGSRGPGRSSLAVSHMDVFPTILDAFGLAPAPMIRGESLIGMQDSKPRIVPQVLFPSENRTQWFGASDGRYRVLWDQETETKRLYDVSVDPNETNDIASMHPERVEALWAALELAILPQQDAVDGSSSELSEEEQLALEALGYASGKDED